jgi:hypothetical protein
MSTAPIVSMILFNSYDADRHMDGNVSTSDNDELEPNSILLNSSTVCHLESFS